jgi:hypothetical protein
MTQQQEMWNARVDAKRAPPGTVPKQEPKTGSLRPFKHASKLYTDIMNLRASWPAGDLMGLQLALGEFAPYVSHGHGWKGRIKNRTIEGIMRRHESKPYPNPGRSEAARRVFQAMPKRGRWLVREIASEELNRDELERGL